MCRRSVDAGRDADTVGSWGDLSGNQNDAKQLTPTLEPLLFAGESDSGAAGHPVIGFNGTERLLRDRNVLGSLGLVIGKYLPVAPFPGPNLYANYFNPTASTSVVARLDSSRCASMAVNPDGGVDGGPIDVSAPDASVYVGARPSVGAGLVGEVAEIVGVRGSMTDEEVAELESYFRKKFGL